MGDLFSILSLGANALSAHRSASATASHNLSNANTPGYSRQRANLEAVLPAYRLGGSFLGRGVALSSVTQARDFGAEKQWTLANQAKANSNAQAEALESLSALDPQRAGALGSALGDFYASMRALQQNPSDLSLRQAAVGQARAVAFSFNRTAEGIDAARDAVDSKLSSQVSEVNQLATEMASLNAQVHEARASGAEPNDLLDARQKTQDRLVELLGVVPVPTSDGDVNLQLPGGASLVTGNKAAQVSTVADAANGGHLSVQMTRTDGTGLATVSSLGGTWGGWIAARDGALKTAETQVDQLAWDWSGAVNAVHRAGFGLDGVSGRDLFDPGTTVTGAASRLTVVPTVYADPAQLAAASSAVTTPGDGTNLQSLIGTETQALSGGSDALSQVASTIAGFGASTSSARAAADADSALFEYATGVRESVSGVSIDEEMIELTKAQRSFEAAMKVIDTTNQMLDTLLSMKTS